MHENLTCDERANAAPVHGEQHLAVLLPLLRFVDQLRVVEAIRVCKNLKFPCLLNKFLFKVGGNPKCIIWQFCTDDKAA